MEKYIILADVTCDLSQQIRDQFGVRDYIKGHIQFSDGRDFRTTLDWSNISRDAFYKDLNNKRLKVSTAPASPEEYYEVFKRYAQEGYKIISMSISSKISSTYDVAVGAAKRVMDEVAGSEIYCFDSFKMSGALGLLVIYAQQMQSQGKSFREVVDWLESNKHRVHQMGPIDDLIVVARRGRISMGKAIMGNFAGVKPMGDCSRDGYVSVLAKAKGISRALEATAKYVQEMATDVEGQYILIDHTDREAYAMKLKELIEARVKAKQVLVSDVFDGCAPNIGPGMVAVYFLGQELTEDLSHEKDVLVRLLSE